MTQNLSDADDRQVFSIDNNLATSGAHSISARAEELKLQFLGGGWARPRRDGAEPRRHTSRNGRPPQRFDELRAIHFARSFTG